MEVCGYCKEGILELQQEYNFMTGITEYRIVCPVCNAWAKSTISLENALREYNARVNEDIVV